MTETRPGPRRHIDTTQRQQALYVRQAALQIKALADQILLDAARGRTVRSNGRQIVTLGLALCEAQAVESHCDETLAKFPAAEAAAAA